MLKKGLLFLFVFLSIGIGQVSGKNYSDNFIIKTENLKQEIKVKRQTKPIIISVYDKNHKPVEGASVKFITTAKKKQGHIDNIEGKTGKDGKFTTSFTAGEKTGTVYLIGHVSYKKRFISEFKERLLIYNLRNILFYIIGGLGIFLFGIKMMSAGLQSIAGDRMKSILEYLTRNTFIGVVLGFIITAVIQSSSATTVMVVGFINAKLLTLFQSVGIIMGANIGTTVTAQIIAFPVKYYAYPIVALGVIFIYMSKRKRLGFLGETLIGLGLLFIGMHLMSSTLKPFSDTRAFSQFFIHFSHNPWLGLLAGILLTSLIQSSSATVGLTMALSMAGLIDIAGAVPIILGDNIGTTITAQLAALSGTRTAKQAAMVHTLFNLVGSIYMIIFITLIKSNGVPLYYKIVEHFTPGSMYMKNGEILFTGNIGRFVANSHLYFNLFNTIIFLPFAKLLAKVAKMIIPDIKKQKYKFFDSHILGNPAIALEHAKNELYFILQKSEKAFLHSVEDLKTQKSTYSDKVFKIEEDVDELQLEITNFLTELSNESLNENELQQIPKLIHSTNDIERISDIAINIEELKNRVNRYNLKLSATQKEDMSSLAEKVGEMMQATLKGIDDKDAEVLKKVLHLEEEVNKVHESMRKEYLEIMSKKKEDVFGGLAVIDFSNYCEKIADYVTNIAEAYLYILA